MNTHIERITKNVIKLRFFFNLTIIYNVDYQDFLSHELFPLEILWLYVHWLQKLPPLQVVSHTLFFSFNFMLTKNTYLLCSQGVPALKIQITTLFFSFIRCFVIFILIIVNFISRLCRLDFLAHELFPFPRVISLRDSQPKYKKLPRYLFLAAHQVFFVYMLTFKVQLPSF